MPTHEDRAGRVRRRPTWPAGTKAVAVSALKPYARNARTHSRRQIKKIAASIERFGFVNPVLIDENNQIIAGHGRVAAAKLLGWQEVPTLRVEHLDEAEKRSAHIFWQITASLPRPAGTERFWRSSCNRS